MISRRISDISYNKKHFNKAKPAYNNALKLVASMNILNSSQHPQQKGTVTKPTSLKYFYDSLTSTSCNKYRK